MIRLSKIILVQFYLYDAVELPLQGDAAFLGPNGSGKTSLLDAIQIAMMGAHGTYLAFNAQSLGGQNKRSIRDYCLGVIRRGESENAASDRKRDHATSYISLVFRDDASEKSFTAGVSISASALERDHKVNGLFVLPGVELTLADHLDTVDDEQLPLEWSDFSQRVARLCKDASTKPSIQPHAEAYIRELLHQLQPQARHINIREFLKAFKNSMRLRSIESVDEFVRKHVIDEHPIDRRRAMAQIEEFRKLKQLVEQVMRQIAALDALAGKFRNGERDYRRSATLHALAAIYDVEHVGEQLDELEETLEAKGAELRNTQRELVRLRAARDEKDRALLQATRNQDPSVHEHRAFELVKEQNVANSKRLQGMINRVAERFARMLREASEHEALRDYHEALTSAVQGLEAAPAQLASGAVTEAGDALSAAADILDTVETALEEALERARGDLQQAKREFEEARAAHERVKKGGARISGGTARLIEQLEASGIHATPLCDLVTVKDPEWQPAIEAYLGGNRESLVIEPGRERDAVAYVRRLPREERPYGVTIIQPAHLRTETWSDPEQVLVGSLLESTNDTALAYVRLQFGQTRQVSTEEELERYSRAMTQDGMLSARGGTRAMRMPRATELLLGAGAGRDQEKEAVALVQSTGVALAEAQNRFKAINDLHVEATRLRSSDERLEEDLGALKEADRNIAEAESKLATLDRAKIEAELAEIKALEEARDALGAQCEEANAQVARLGTAIEHLSTKVEELRGALRGLTARQRELCQADDFDGELLDQQRERFDQLPFAAPRQRIEKCEHEANLAKERADRAMADTLPEFRTYVDGHGIAVLEERSDWRLAYKWVLAESTRLKDSQLTQYREQADLAREAAEQAFRKDIALRLRESIQRMRLNLRSLDQTLAACPPFSNGERYRFEAKPAENHKALYQFIMDAAEDDAQGGLFQTQDPIQDKILELLEEQASSDAVRMPNPLEDYRLLFTFDLLILDRDGEVISRLSKRIGSGSNGEHRTPFYVIAGAALAAAYRIAPGKKPEGAALMLLDEAFHGMDHQNAIATAQFLSEIGLQLVMAAPESDHAKLAALCQTTYDISRDNLDVFIEASEIKPAGQALLQSDLPFRHPELFEQRVQELKAAEEAGTAA